MWHYSHGKECLRAAARPADNASASRVATGSTHKADVALGQGPTGPTRLASGLIRKVLWGCAIFVVISVFSLQYVLADIAPPPGQPKPPRPTPKPDPPSQTSPGLFSDLSTRGALLGTGCVVGSVELLAIAGLIVSRRRRKDEMASGESPASPVETGELTDTQQDDNR